MPCWHTSKVGLPPSSSPQTQANANQTCTVSYDDLIANVIRANQQEKAIFEVMFDNEMDNCVVDPVTGNAYEYRYLIQAPSTRVLWIKSLSTIGAIDAQKTFMADALDECVIEIASLKYMATENSHRLANGEKWRVP
jgi:hypothetical protein